MKYTGTAHSSLAQRSRSWGGQDRMLPDLHSSYVIQAFDWAFLGAGLVVDVGGSRGLISMDLAKAFPSVLFVVQDLPQVIEGAEKDVPDNLAARVTFVAHDMFTEQSVKDADVYYLRWFMHDWPDAHYVKILKALIPALKPEACVILSEKCLEPPCTLPPEQERWNR